MTCDLKRFISFSHFAQFFKKLFIRYIRIKRERHSNVRFYLICNIIVLFLYFLYLADIRKTDHDQYISFVRVIECHIIPC